MKILFKYLLIFFLMKLPLIFIRWVVPYINNDTKSFFLYLLYTVVETRRRYKQKFHIPLRFKRKNPLTIVNIYGDDRMGITDRFKGMIILSDFCEDNQCIHKIFHKYPFDLNEYIVPNNPQKSWSITNEEYDQIINNRSLFLCITHLRNKKIAISTLRLFAEINGVETILLSISGVVGEKEFGEKFKKIFKLSNHLEDLIIRYKNQLNLNEYVTVSFRFANLLGNSNEKIFKELNEEDKENLLRLCLLEINKLSDKYMCNIFITSDNSYFLSVLDDLKIPKICHFPINTLDNHHIAFGGDISKNSVEKMMVEFFVISQARKVIQIKIGNMYNSGFPLYAASIGEKPYELIQIQR